ncbi:unnamed protein product [Sphagnum balticum]
MTPPPSQLLLLLAAYYCCAFHQFSHDRILSAHSNCSLFLSVFTSLKGSDCMQAATAGACKPITDDLQQCRKLRRRRRPAETKLLLVKVSSNALWGLLVARLHDRELSYIEVLERKVQLVLEVHDWGVTLVDTARIEAD